MAWLEPLSDTDWQQLADGVAWFTPSGSRSLRLTGHDRLNFLNGQVTQDMRRLQPGDRRQTLMLNIKGQAQALMDVHVRPDDVHIWVHGHRQPFVWDALKRHIVFDDVTLTDLTETLQHVVVTGREAETWTLDRLGIAIPQPTSFQAVERAGATLLVAAFERSPFPAVSISMLAKDASRVVDALGLNDHHALSVEAEDVLGLAAGHPAMTEGYGVGQLPQVLGLEGLVDHHKGCYLGQEVMARLDARANLKRVLKPFHQKGAAETVDPSELQTASGVKAGVVWQASTMQPGEVRFGLALCDKDVLGEESLMLDGAPVITEPLALIGRSEP